MSVLVQKPVGLLGPISDVFFQPWRNLHNQQHLYCVI